MGKQASRRHGLTTTWRGRRRRRRRRHGWVHRVGLSHNLTLCFASLLSVSPLYSLLFFPFFTLVFFALSVTPFGAECCFFFFNRLPGSWAPGLGRSWVLDWRTNYWAVGCKSKQLRDILTSNFDITDDLGWNWFSKSQTSPYMIYFCDRDLLWIVSWNVLYHHCTWVVVMWYIMG